MDDQVADCTTDGTCEADSGGGAVKTPMAGVKFSDLSLMEETRLAAQQLSVVLGVMLLVGFLFFAMIAVDKFLEYCNEKIDDFLGKTRAEDPEDPAALVGSFKRYK